MMKTIKFLDLQNVTKCHEQEILEAVTRVVVRIINSFNPNRL